MEFFKAENKHMDYYDSNQNQGYCKAVIAPKVSKIVAEFKERLKPQYK